MKLFLQVERLCLVLLSYGGVAQDRYVNYFLLFLGNVLRLGFAIFLPIVDVVWWSCASREHFDARL